MISRYYSFGFIHGIPKDSIGKNVFLEERVKITKESIDSYCVRMSKEWCKPLLSSYKKIIQSSFETPLVLTYEEYASNPLNAISRIFQYCEIEQFQKLASTLAAEANPIRDHINNTAHKRSGKVGQYKKELSNQTILEINSILREELEYFCWNNT